MKTQWGDIFGLWDDRPRMSKAACIRKISLSKILKFMHSHSLRVVVLFKSIACTLGYKGPFYRKPLSNSNPPKFGTQVIGRNKLATLMKEMCANAGLKGNFTNHSGKATCASRLFEHDVDEQLIMRQTGHRSSAVR